MTEGWHRDYAALLGRRPTLATLSLRAVRRFDLRPQPGRPGAALSLDLEPGRLLVMQGNTQENWEHRMAKSTRPGGERISLTWRWLYAPGPRDEPIG